MRARVDSPVKKTWILKLPRPENDENKQEVGVGPSCCERSRLAPGQVIVREAAERSRGKGGQGSSTVRESLMLKPGAGHEAWPESPILERRKPCAPEAAVEGRATPAHVTRLPGDSLPPMEQGPFVATPHTTTPQNKPVTPPGTCPPGSAPRRTPARHRAPGISPVCCSTGPALCAEIARGHRRPGQDRRSTVSQVLEMCAMDLERWAGTGTPAALGGGAFSASATSSAAEVAASWMRAGCAGLLIGGGDLSSEYARSPISSGTLVLLSAACGGAASARLWHMPNKPEHGAHAEPSCVASSDASLASKPLLDAASARTAQQLQQICPVLVDAPLSAGDAPPDSSSFLSEQVGVQVCVCVCVCASAVCVCACVR